MKISISDSRNRRDCKILGIEGGELFNCHEPEHPDKKNKNKNYQVNAILKG